MLGWWHFCREQWWRLRRWYRRALVYVLRRPVVVGALLPVYLLVGGAVVFSFAALLIGLVLLTGAGPESVWFGIGYYFLAPVFAVPVLLHFLWLTLRAFQYHVFSTLRLSLVGPLLQVLLSVVVIYAAIYYVMQSLSECHAFANMACAYRHSWRDEFTNTMYGPIIEVVWRHLSHRPSIDAVVDSVYFSVVAISTVGFGDIHPATWWAKLTTATELITGFVIVALALGSVIGQQATHPRRRAKQLDRPNTGDE